MIINICDVMVLGWREIVSNTGYTGKRLLVRIVLELVHQPCSFAVKLDSISSTT